MVHDNFSSVCILTKCLCSKVRKESEQTFIEFQFFDVLTESLQVPPLKMTENETVYVCLVDHFFPFRALILNNIVVVGDFIKFVIFD